MPESVSRSVLNALLPPGAAWVPAEDKDMDLLFDGIAENNEVIRLFLGSLADIRDPQRTPILDDLEKEFGVSFNSSLTEQERRDQLSSAKTANKGNGSASFMQTKLQQSGFDLQVHANDPAVDPDILLANGFNVYFDGVNAFFGNSLATFGRTAGFLVVNGDEQFDTFSVPASSDAWPFIFFIGGDATRNGTTGALELINVASVDISRRGELLRLIVKYKPLHSWCGLLVSFET